MKQWRTYLILILALFIGWQTLPDSAYSQDKPVDEDGESTAAEAAKKLDAFRQEKEKIRYEPSDKRDPFIPLIVVNPQTRQQGPRPEGFAGLTVSELKLKGVWLSDPDAGGYQAFFVGPDTQSYMQKVGDRCYNGRIITIEDNAVIFEEYQFDFGGRPRPPKTIKIYVHQPSK